MARPDRTSATDPLRIAELPIGSQGGRIGLTLCPGRQDANAYEGPWRRDLGQDLEQVHGWGAAAVLTLIEDHEMQCLGVSRLGAEIQDRGMRWLHLPIKDLQAPDYRFHAAWPTARSTIDAHLSAGLGVLLHCKAGLGRAGTVAALLLIEHGATPIDAIARVRAARPGAIESESQVRFLLSRPKHH